MVGLVALWCRMGLVEKNGQWRNVHAGVRQGGVISPLLANLNTLMKVSPFWASIFAGKRGPLIPRR